MQAALSDSADRSEPATKDQLGQLLSRRCGHGRLARLMTIKRSLRSGRVSDRVLRVVMAVCLAWRVGFRLRVARLRLLCLGVRS